jgi:hypothetical protein
MAWKPWAERVAEMDSLEERNAFLRGIFGPPPLTERKLAGMALTAALAGWAVSRNLKRSREK